MSVLKSAFVDFGREVRFLSKMKKKSTALIKTVLTVKYFSFVNISGWQKKKNSACEILNTICFVFFLQDKK